MKRSVQERLLAINREFYQRFGPEFSGTRFGAQPGWDRIIHYFPARGAVLDLGCGNGRLALFLEEMLLGHRDEEVQQEADGEKMIRYVGVDGSDALLAIAREKTGSLQHVSAEFLQVDLSARAWRRASRYFDVVTALAVLHHIPGFEARAAFVRAAGQCLKPGGALILSNWRFMHNARMRRKLLPWAAAGLTADDVERGDYLLDWKQGGRGMRYVHQVDEGEVAQLAAAAGLRVAAQFTADGREGDLSLYSVLAAHGED